MLKYKSLLALCLLLSHWSKQVAGPTLVSRMEKGSFSLDVAGHIEKGMCIQEWEEFVAVLQSTKPLYILLTNSKKLCMIMLDHVNLPKFCFVTCTWPDNLMLVNLLNPKNYF